MIGGMFGSSRAAREGRRTFGIGVMLGLALNLSFTALFQPVSAYGQTDDVIAPAALEDAARRTVEGIREGALTPVGADSPDLLQQQSAVYEALFGAALEGAGSYYDLDAYPEEGGAFAAQNVENEQLVTLDAVAVLPIDFGDVDLGALDLTEDELALYGAAKPESCMVIGRLVSDLGEAPFVGLGVRWDPVDGVQYPAMLKVMGDVQGFFGEGAEPEDFAGGLGRGVAPHAQAAVVQCPDGRVVQPDQEYLTCMGNAQITFEHCLISVAILVAKCIAAAVLTQAVRMLACKRLVLPWLVKGCLIALAAWLAAQIIWCTVNIGGGVASCLNDKIRDQRICANNLCGRTPVVVTPGPVNPKQTVNPTPVEPGIPSIDYH